MLHGSVTEEMDVRRNRSVVAHPTYISCAHLLTLVKITQNLSTAAVPTDIQTGHLSITNREHHFFTSFILSQEQKAIQIYAAISFPIYTSRN